MSDTRRRLLAADMYATGHNAQAVARSLDDDLGLGGSTLKTQVNGKSPGEGHDHDRNLGAPEAACAHPTHDLEWSAMELAGRLVRAEREAARMWQP